MLKVSITLPSGIFQYILSIFGDVKILLLLEFPFSFSKRLIISMLLLNTETVFWQFFSGRGVKRNYKSHGKTRFKSSGV